MAEPTDPDQPVYDRWSRPQALSNRGYVLVVVVVVLLAAAAFGVVSLVSSGDTGSGTTIRIPVSGAAVSGGDATSIRGTLRLSTDRCVYLEPPGGGDRVTPIWPSGYHAVLNGNRLSLYDGGKIVAVDGDLLEMTGRPAPAGNFSGQPCVPESGEVDVVESDVTVAR